MVGDRLRDLDGATRIHVFGDVRRTEAVTTNSFQGLRIPLAFSFSTSRAWIVECLESFKSFRDSCRRKAKVKHSDLTPGTSMQRPTASLAFDFIARNASPKAESALPRLNQRSKNPYNYLITSSERICVPRNRSEIRPRQNSALLRGRLHKDSANLLDRF
jgi:hypothetical protein